MSVTGIHDKTILKLSIFNLKILKFYVAKCNLGKINLEAMPSSNLWMQEARLQPWRFAGAICDAYTQYAATAGRIKLGVARGPVQGRFMTFTRSVLLAIIRKLISLAHSLASFAFVFKVSSVSLFIHVH